MALKMFDASAKLAPAGMLTNFILHHPGTFDSCLEVASPGLNGEGRGRKDVIAPGQHCLLTSYATGYEWAIGADLPLQDDGRQSEEAAHHGATAWGGMASRRR
jgi:hypothetical protein